MKKPLRTLAAILLICLLLIQIMPAQVRATSNPTGIGLAEFALKAWREGWGYVYGTYGQYTTQSLIDGKASQYPAVFAEIMSDGQTAYQNARDWIGRRSADCAGLIKAYLWWLGDSVGPGYASSQDRSANGIYYASTIRGPVSTIPEIHGLLVWRDGHIGIYIGNGEVIESRGVEYGVVKTRLSDRNWTHWCTCPDAGYPATGWTRFDGQPCYYSSGVFLTGTQVIGGKTYRFGANGSQRTGFHLTGGQYRYFTADGSVLTGWQTIGGERRYLDLSGCAAAGWQQVDGQYRLFGEQGILLTGWQETAEGIYYLNDQGVPLTGDQTIGGRQLTFAQSGTAGVNGKLLTGWQNLDGRIYYFGQSGQKASGLQLIGGQAFLFAEDGARNSGWQEADGKRYYFAADTGAALTGLQTIDSQAWLFGADGALHRDNGLLFTPDQIYLSDGEGHPQTGLQEISGYSGADASPLAASLVFAADYSLLMANQDVFALIQPQESLIAGSAAASAFQLAINGTNSSPAWLSLDPAVAQVSPEGLVTAVNPGQAVVVLLDGSGSYAAARITVLPDPSGLAALAPLTLEPGQSADLAVAGLPGNLLEACVLTSSDPSVITVSYGGRLLALRPGSATVTLSCGGQTIPIQEVTAAVPLLGLSASRTALTLPPGATAAAFAAPVPALAGTASIRMESSNPTVAAISDTGKISALAAGSAAVTVRAGELAVSCTVQVAGTWPELSQGSTDILVRPLQQRLQELGYLAGTVDGIYGPWTEFAVASFQQKLQVPLTGRASHDLQNALQAQTAPAASIRFTGTLSPGDAGEAVLVLQQRLYELNVLKGKPSGTYDSLTRQAVTTLLTLNNLPSADCVDPSVISLLYSRAVKSGRPALIPGDSGYEVLLLQTRLQALQYYIGPLDSQYTPALDYAVREFQAQCSLTVDGEAGPITQGRLFAA
ncbi:MAG TPA: hypothetical protein DD640_03790, partial [Clostridiales bacterium]|nr:hypothetical protein [Clostridiales bacterium]